MSDSTPKAVLVTGANGYIGNAVARAFVRAGWTTYGLVRKESAIPYLASQEIIPLLGSPSDTKFLTSLNEKKVIFDVIVSTTEQILDYIPHYKDIISLLRTLATTSNVAGVRPLVLFTSGCKDYGMSPHLADSPDLAPHTEDSPLNSPPVLANRTKYAIQTFEHMDLFDAIVTRPTNVYGLSSSYYGEFFRFAEEAKKKGVLEFYEHPKTMLHALHVDSCGEAYVALAEHPDRNLVKGQCYNISSYRFETLEEIAEALAKEYEIEGGVKFLGNRDGGEEGPEVKVSGMLFGFSQWTGSEKLRRDTGWRDQRILFSRGLRQYRIAYEAAREEGYNAFKFW